MEKTRGYSDLTIAGYDATLTEAFALIEVISQERETILNLMPYRIKIASLRPKTISKKLSALRSFSAYLKTQGISVTLRSDESVKVPKTLPKPIAHKYIVEALSHANLQERLIITMLYTLGLRISELANLELDKIGSSWVRVLGKGSKERDVPLLASTKKVLDEYRAVMMPKKFLFEHNSRKLSENSLRYSVTKAFERISMKVTPHQLRHSYASELLNRNAPISDVSELLGHSSMATTQIYTKLGSALKKENYNRAHPLCGDE